MASRVLKRPFVDRRRLHLLLVASDRAPWPKKSVLRIELADEMFVRDSLHLLSDANTQVDYCLDAPVDIPAGSTCSTKTSSGVVTGQRLVHR